MAQPPIHLSAPRVAGGQSCRVGIPLGIPFYLLVLEALGIGWVLLHNANPAWISSSSEVQISEDFVNVCGGCL